MICSNCNIETEDDSKFCENCGTKFVKVNQYICNNCNSILTVQSKFCNKCGQPTNKIPENFTETYDNGVRGGSEEVDKRNKIFPGQSKYIKEVADYVYYFISTEVNLETQILEEDNQFVIQGKKRNINFIKTALGMDMAVTVHLIKKGNNLEVNVGAGKWMDKAAGLAVAWFLFWPAILSSSWGILQQKKLFSKIEKKIELYIASFN